VAAVLTAKGTSTSKVAVGLTHTLAAVAISDGASVIVSVAYLNLVALVTGITWNGAALSLVTTKSGTSGVVDVWALHGATGGTGDVVVTFDNTGSTSALAVDQVVGLTTSPNDKTAVATGSSTTPSSGATATTSQANELWLGAICTVGPSGDTAGTWSNSFTADQRAGNTGGTATTNATISTGYRVVTSAAAATAAKTGITTREWEAAVATFKSAADQSVSLGVASSASAGLGPSADAGTASVALTTATPASAGLGPTVSAGAASLALGVGTAASSGYAPAVTGDVSIDLAACTVASDVPAAVSSNVLDNQAVAVQTADPPTTDFEPDPGNVASASSSGVRSNGDAYFAMWMQNLSGFLQIGGGEESAIILMALHSPPQQYASPSEPHWLASFHEVAGSELFTIGVTPDLRICVYTYGRPILMTAAGTLPADSQVHQIELFSPGGGSRQIYLDGIRIAQDFVDNLATIGLFSPTDQQCRVMLFNGVAGTTRCACSIYAFEYATENSNFVWPMNESHGLVALGYECTSSLGQPIVPRAEPDFPGVDWGLTAGFYDPTPAYPRTWPVGTGNVKNSYKWLRGTRYREVSIVAPAFTEITSDEGPFAPVEGP
jgi:hypothetical protein